MNHLNNNAKKLAENLLSRFSIYEEFNILNINTVFVAGSIFEGFGNSRSDIDIFIILNRIDDQVLTSFVNQNQDFSLFKREHKRMLTITYREVDYDIELHEVDAIQNYAELVNRGQGSKYSPYYDFFHRLKFAQPLGGVEFFRKLKNSIDYNKYNLIVPLGVRMYYSIRVTDIQGAFEEGAYDTSLYMALSLLEDCISSYLSLFGETNPNKKWLIKKIHRLEKSNQLNISLSESMVISYNQIDFLDELSLKAKTVIVLKECQKINLECEKLIAQYTE